MEQRRKSRKIPFLPVIAGMMIIVPMLVVAGCTGNPPLSNSPELDGTTWVLTGYLSDSRIVSPVSGTTITLEFGKENNLGGSAGCNHYFARYALKGTKITIGQAGSTEMYCVTPGVMEQESAYLSLLQKAVSVTAGNETLTFADTAGTTILAFAKEVPPAPVPLAGTNWTLDALYTGDAVSSVISGTTITALFDKDWRIGGNAGCNHYFGSYTLNGSSLAISNIGSTKMHCTGDGIMQQESTYLASLGKVAGFTITGDRLTLADANGKPLLSFVKEACGSDIYRIP